jgi:hypothetical protein
MERDIGGRETKANHEESDMPSAMELVAAAKSQIENLSPAQVAAELKVSDILLDESDDGANR